LAAVPFFLGDGALFEFFGDSGCEGYGSFDVGEEGAAAVFLCDFVDGAAHVDVDDGGTVLDGPAGTLGHDVGVAAVELHADGLVEVVGLGEVEAGCGAAEEALRGEEVGAGETDAAPLAADGAEGKVAVAGDGGQEEGRGELDGAEAEHAEG
jgi:hypothetical protein